MNDLKGIIEDCNKSDLISDKVIKKIIEIIGQEEWNDLHDENSDICTTMGELIITLKGIAELENKIADIKANCDLAIEGRDIKIKELEQQIEKMKCCYNCSKWNDGQCEDIKDGYFFHCADFGCDKWELEND